MNQKTLYKVFIWGFLLLYLFVAGISFCHAIQFFCIGNPMIMSIILAFAFELGLALSLAAVLLSDANKKATLPWILMIILTFVQVIGNVYSVEKFICESNAVYYQYLSNALLFWIEGISEQTVQVIISWIMGAILPIIALFMTDMVATNIKNMAAIKSTNNELRPVIDNVEESFIKDLQKEDNLEDYLSKVEVKNVEPVEVKESDSSVKEKISNKLNKLFAENNINNASKDSSAVLNAPANKESNFYRKMLPGAFESPEITKE
jgi:hypothetical protein